MNKLSCALVALVATSALSAKADSQSWMGAGANGNWSTPNNWSGSPIPGSTSSITNTDTATFKSAIANTWGNAAANPVVINSAMQDIGSINFTLAPGNYFVGSTGGNPLLLTSGGSIVINAGLTSTNAVETINAPLVVEGNAGAYSFTNNSANGTGTGAGTLNFGGVITGIGSSGSTTTLTLGGSNTNASTINGVIGNGSGGGKVGVSKTGAGMWVLNGANSFTGGIAVSGGTLGFNTQANLNSASPNTITLSNGGALQWNTAASYGSGANNFSDAIALAGSGGALNGWGDMIIGSTVSGGTSSNGLTLGVSTVATGAADFIWNTSTASTAGKVTISGSTNRVLLLGSGLLGNSAAVTVVNGGDLDFGLAGTFANAISLASGTILQSRVNTATLSNVALPGSGNVTIGGDDSSQGGAIKITNAQVLTGDLAIGVSASGTATNISTISGNIAGSGGLTVANSANTGSWGKNGTEGGFNLSGSNTYTGSTTVALTNFGALNIQGDNSGAGTTYNVQNGLLYLTSTGKISNASQVALGTASSSGALLLGDTATAGSAKTQTIASLTATGSGNTVANSGDSAGSTLIINNSVSDTYSGGWGGTSTNQNVLNITKSGGGDFIDTGTGTSTGTFTITAGAFFANGASAVAAGSTGVGNVAVNGGILAGSGVIKPTAGNKVTVADGGNLRPGVAPNAATPTVANGFLTLTAASNSAPPVLSFTTPTLANDPAQLTFALGSGSGVSGTGLTLAGSSSYLNFNVNQITGDVVFSSSSAKPTLAHIQNLVPDLTKGNYLLMQAPANNDYVNLVTGSGGLITGGLALDSISSGWGKLFLQNGDIYLDVIPEPSTYALLLVGLAVLITLRRRVPAAQLPA